MSINLVCICDNDLVVKELKHYGEIADINIRCEIQSNNEIVEKLSIDEIESSNAIVLITQKKVDQIIDGDRFIHRNYYYVLPIFVLQSAKTIIGEIVEDLKIEV